MPCWRYPLPSAAWAISTSIVGPLRRERPYIRRHSIAFALINEFFSRSICHLPYPE